MKVTFPIIGDIHLYGRLLFAELGVELISPLPNSLKGLERGSKLSPPDICLPFKLMVDNLISAWEQGADTVVMTATMGPCRLGEYGELLKTVLDRQGCNFHWILLDSVTAIGRKEFMKRLASIAQDSQLSTAGKILTLKRVYQIIKGFEKLEQRARIMSGYERKKGASEGIIKSCRRELEIVPDFRSARVAIRRSKQALAKVGLDTSKNPVKLLVTGEIFTSIDPFGNQYLEERLMQMGVSFEKRISLGWWIDRTILNPT